MRAGDGDARRDKEVDKEVDEDVDEDVVAALALEFGGGDGAGGDLNAHEWSRDAGSARKNQPHTRVLSVGQPRVRDP